MSFARSLLLLLALALAWVAVYLLDHLSLAGLYPDWLLARVPRLAYSLQWLPGDVRTLGVWLALLASLFFGLAIPTWIGISSRRLEVHPEAGMPVRGNAAFLLVLAAMLVVSLILATTTPAYGMVLNDLVRTGLWLGAIGLGLLAAGLAQRGRTRRVASDDGGAPERAWPWLLVVLVAAAAFFAWQNGRIPGTFPEQSFLVGIQSLEPATPGAGPLAVGSAGLLRFATALTSLSQLLATTPVAGLVWSGLASGLGLVVSVWLLACELFRRTRLYDGDGEVIDDDGYLPALWAAMATVAALPVIHFARLPHFLEPTFWGALGIWALLRGARRGRHVWMVASGVGLGFAILTHSSGLIFAGVGILTWLGLALLRGRWLRSELGGVGWKGLLLWLVTLTAVAAPGLCLWACGPESPAGRWFQSFSGWSDLWLGMRATVERLGISLDAQPSQGLAIAAYGIALAPMLLLGFAGQLFQMDQLLGWIGASWLLLVLVAAAPVDDPTVRWSLLLAGIPAAAIGIAFGFDRMRATFTRTMGGWVNGAASLLAGGLIVVAALAAWRTYPATTGVFPDAPSALARAIAPAVAANPQRPLALLTASDLPSWDSPALRLAAHDHDSTAPRLTLPANDTASWPATLPAAARVYVPPTLSSMSTTLTARYPGGFFLVRRDVRGNPAVYIYQLP